MLLLLTVALAASACQRKVRTFGDDDRFPERLSDWNLFLGDPSALQPNQGVVAYDLNTPLFSDYAIKRRFLWMPAGSAARYRDQASFDFPVGTILTKTFSFPDSSNKQRLIETRLLVRTQSAWYPLPYVWNAAQTDAVLNMSADPVRVTYRSASFNYAIPNANQCAACHGKLKDLAPLGVKARNLNRDLAYGGLRENQLEHWTRIGYLTGAPDPHSAPRAAVWNDPASGTLDARARAYLDVNCRHCHADGLRGDLPGSMESSDEKTRMPSLGRTLVHREGVELIRAWVKGRVHSENQYSW